MILLAAGVADLAAGALTSALGGVRGLLGRADLGELVDEGQQEIKARGRLALDRLGSRPPAHMEKLARRVRADRGSPGV